MKIKQFEVAGLAQYSYMLSSEGEAVVIDPMRDFDRYTTYAQEHGLTIKFVTETHIHADFVSGARALAEVSEAELALSSYDQEPYRYSMEHQALRDGDVLRIGELRLAALHTPGHTPEHLSFVLFDEERDASEPVALSAATFSLWGRSAARTCWAKTPSNNSHTSSTAAFTSESLPFRMASSFTQVTVRVRCAAPA